MPGGGIPTEDELAAEIARIEAELEASSRGMKTSIHSSQTPKRQNSGRNGFQADSKRGLPSAPKTNPSVLDIEQEILRMQQELEAASASASRTMTSPRNGGNRRPSARQSKSKPPSVPDNSSELDIEAEIRRLEMEMASTNPAAPVRKSISTKAKPQQSKTSRRSITQPTSSIDLEEEILRMQLEIQKASSSASTAMTNRPPLQSKPSRRISDTAKRASLAITAGNRLQREIDAMEASIRSGDASTASFSSIATPLLSNRNQSSNYNTKDLLPPLSISTVSPNIDLDQEIRMMEAEINRHSQRQQPQHAPKKELRAEEKKRMKLDEEIKKMEAELAAAAALKSKRSNTDDNITEIVSMGKGNEKPEKKWGTPVANDSENDTAQTQRPPHPLFGGGGGGMMRNPLLAAIEKTANEREQRLEETGGQLLMQEIEPEVQGGNQGPQQISFSMAEMITQKAMARDKRLAEGGEKKMTKLKPKSDYKKDFTNIAMDAAALGRLTRLNEHTIEAIAQEKTPEEEWKSRGLLAIEWGKPSHLSIIQEAANLGAQTKKQEKVVSNFVEENEEGYDDADAMWDEYYNSRTTTDPSTSHLNKLFELDAKAGTGQQKVDTLLLGLREENYPNAGDNSHLIKPMDFYKHASLDDVKLPKALPPRIDPKKNKEKYEKKLLESGDRPMTDIGHTVAELAWSRRTRLDRPGSLPIVKERCPCPYCVNPSPYQTYAYRVLENSLKESGEWEKMRQPLRMDDPRVRAMAKAAEHKYGAASNLPSTVNDADKENLRVKQKPNKIAEEEKKERKEVAPAQPVAPAPPPTPPPPPPKVTQPAPPPDQACCACVIL